MTAHKYFIIIHRMQFSEISILCSLLLVWMISFLISIIYYAIAGPAIDSLYALQSNKMWCFMDMSGRDSINVTGTILIILVIVATIFTLIAAHFSIIQKYRTLITESRKRKRIGKRTLKGKQENEWKLVKKSIAISSLFSIVYVFFLVKAVYEVLSHNQVSPEFENVVLYAILLGPISNVIILYIYDAKFKQNIQQVFNSFSVFLSLPGQQQDPLTNEIASASVKPSLDQDLQQPAGKTSNHQKTIILSR